MTHSAELSRKAVQGTLWTYLSYASGKALTFVSTVILARLLLKEDFGVAGYALVVISFLNVLTDIGVGAALIYHHDDEEAIDTAFWLGLISGGLLFVLTWLLAPAVGEFFHDVRAVPLTRAMGLTFPFSAIGNTHDALLRRRLRFGRKFVPDIAKAFIKGSTSIVLALAGMGAWSLVIGQLAGAASASAAFWVVIPWRPSFRFSRRAARALLSYGTNIIIVDALAIMLQNADYVFIGRFLGATALGVYTIAFRVPEILIVRFCTMIGIVIFPIFAKVRDDRALLGNGFLLTLRYVAMITVPLSLGTALVAEPFVLAVFTDKWAEAIPVLRAIAFYALFLSLSYNAGSVYKAQGRPQLLAKLAGLRVTLLLPALYWAVTGPGTVAAVGWSHAAVALVSGGINLAVASRMLRIPVAALFAALRPTVIGSLLMALAVLVTLSIAGEAGAWLQLAFAVIVGGLVYGAVQWWLQTENLRAAGRTLRAALSRT